MKEFKIENIPNQISLHIKDRASQQEARREFFIKEFQIRFSKIDKSIKDWAERILDHNIFDSPLRSFIEGNNIATIIELHAILERRSIDNFPLFLKGELTIGYDSLSMCIYDLIGNKSLRDMYQYYQKWNVWNTKDGDFIEKLTKKRNSLAHYNIQKIKNSFAIKENFQTPAIYKKIDALNILPDFLETIYLVAKLYAVFSSFSKKTNKTVVNLKNLLKKYELKQ